VKIATAHDRQPWEEMPKREQLNLFKDMCGDLADQLPWHGGIRLSRDDYRHMIAGTILHWRTMPGISRDGEPRGWIMLGGSSNDLTKEQCGEAITLALLIGDKPEDQGLKSRPVEWGYSVMRGLGYTDDDIQRLAA
jgi:hypothetical protein